MKKRIDFKDFIFRSRNNPKGFSLPEMMVTMLLFAFLTAGLYTTMSTGENTWLRSNVQIGLQQELRKAMEWMKQDLVETGAGAILNVPANGYWYPSITFYTPSGVTGGTLVWNASPIAFYLNSQNLQRVTTTETRILATDIQSAQFRRQASTPNILEISLVGQKSTPKGGTLNYQLDFQSELRN